MCYRPTARKGSRLSNNLAMLHEQFIVDYAIRTAHLDAVWIFYGKKPPF